MISVLHLQSKTERGAVHINARTAQHWTLGSFTFGAFLPVSAVLRVLQRTCNHDHSTVALLRTLTRVPRYD